MKITGICVHKKYRDREMYMDKECVGDREREKKRGGEEGQEAEGAKRKRGREHTNKWGKYCPLRLGVNQSVARDSFSLLIFASLSK